MRARISLQTWNRAQASQKCQCLIIKAKWNINASDGRDGLFGGEKLLNMQTRLRCLNLRSTNSRQMKVYAEGVRVVCVLCLRTVNCPQTVFSRPILLPIADQGCPNLLRSWGVTRVTHLIYVRGRKSCISRCEANLNWAGVGDDDGSFTITSVVWNVTI